MKVIFSRKGFDGTAGGCPSPIVEGRPLSLPIPTKMKSPKTYGDLNGLYGELVTDLTSGRRNEGKRLTAQSICHLDPDINTASLPRQAGWRGSLGQVGAAQGHLAKQGIQTGDLFIFWGLFRHVEHHDRWEFVGEPEHRVWGWLQIGDRIELGEDGTHVLMDRPWLADHPHVRAGWSKQNVLYVASESLELGSGEMALPGSGILKSGYRLTESGATSSIWRVPDWLNPQRGGCGMTFNPDSRWRKDGTVQTPGRGQEFVADIGEREEAKLWLNKILTEN